MGKNLCALVLAVSSSAVIAGEGCSSSQPPPSAEWVVLERVASDQETVLYVEVDGAFEGHVGTTHLVGQLDETELSQLMELTREKHWSLYRQQQLSDADLEQNPVPRFRLVLHSPETQERQFEASWAPERQSLDVQTSKLIAFMGEVLDEAAR